MYFQEKREEWQTVFYITAGIVLFGWVFYLVFGSGELQEWARHKPANPDPLENKHGQDLVADIGLSQRNVIISAILVKDLIPQAGDESTQPEAAQEASPINSQSEVKSQPDKFEDKQIVNENFSET